MTSGRVGSPWKVDQEPDPVQAVASVAADRMQKRSMNPGHMLAPIPALPGGNPMGQEDPNDRARFLQLDGAAQAHAAYTGTRSLFTPVSLLC